MHWIKSKTVPKVKQPGENISIKYIHNYAAETNFENFIDGEKKFQDFSSISNFPRTVFSKQFWFPGLSRTFQDFPGPVATLGVIMGVILLVLRELARSIL